ncbi:ATP-binding protein [Spirochaeta dissipatitropha]
MSQDLSFDYLNTPSCPITGLDIVLRPEWTFTTIDDHYTGYITQIGSNIFIYKAVGRPTPLDSPGSHAHVQRFLAENLAAGKKFYALFDYSELIPPPVRNRTNLLQSLKELLPRLHLVIFFNMNPPMRTVVNIAIHLSGIRKHMFTARGYEDALTIVKTDMLRKGIRNTTISPQNEIANRLMGLLGQLIWEEDYDADIPHLPPDHDFCGVFEAVSVLRDDLREAQKENLHKQELLEHANRIKDEFIENMSHEMRSPLNGIIGAVHLLEKTGLSTEQQHYSMILKQASTSLLAGVNQLLDLAVLNTGQQEVRTVNFRLSDFFSSVAAIFEPACHEKKLALEVYIDDVLPEAVSGDRDRIRQILINLLANAVNYTSAGAVVVEVEGQVQEKLLYISVRVRDSGCGIPDDMREKLFQRFSKGLTAFSDAGGSGLGLSISRGLARQLGGELQLESSSSEGSVFLLEIPLSIANPADLADEAGLEIPEKLVGEQAVTPDWKRALVVDDDAINRDVLCGFLAHLGIYAEQAASAKDALDAFHARNFDILFVDCSMPDMDGMTLSRHLRDTFERARYIPILAVTAYTEKQKGHEIKAAGMNDILTKPLGFQQIQAVVGKYLGSGGQFSEESSVVDNEVLDPELLPVLCDRIRQYLETDLPVMKQALTIGDLPVIKKRAHSLHGVLAQLGIHDEARRLRKIEHAADSEPGAVDLEILIADSEESLTAWYSANCRAT